MISYIETLLAFNNGGVRCSNEVSPSLIEKGLKLVFTGLHNGYLHDKMKMNFSFTLGKKLFFRKYGHLEFSNESMMMHYQMVMDIAHHIVDHHDETVRQYFETNEPGKYCELMKQTIFRGMVNNDGDQYKAMPNTPAKIDGLAECMEEEGKGLSFSDSGLDCNLNKAQMAKLAEFINENHLCKHEVTPQCMEDFFACKHGHSIRAKVNAKMVLLLECLQNKGWIGRTWKAQVAYYKLMRSSSNENKHLGQHDLAQSLYATSRKEPGPLEKKIIEFVDSLADIK